MLLAGWKDRSLSSQQKNYRMHGRYFYNKIVTQYFQQIYYCNYRRQVASENLSVGLKEFRTSEIYLLLSGNTYQLN